MAHKSTAAATWRGTLTEGKGSVSTTSPALSGTEITWRARNGEDAGTTPEELLAAAHAGCFSMALSGGLAADGHEVKKVDTSATYEFGPDGEGGFSISGAHLTVEADVPGVSDDVFMRAAETAKNGCPVSKALTGIKITLDAKLVAHA